MNEFKLLIVGDKDFAQEALLSEAIDVISETMIDDAKLAFVTAMEPGAGALSYMYAHQNGINCYEYQPNRKDGINAELNMRRKMADFADGVLVFCKDPKEARHIINYMQANRKNVAVIQYNRKKS